MDNVGDWLYIVFLIIAAVSGLFSSKDKKKKSRPDILGQPDREIGPMTSLQKEKASGRYWRICKRKRKNLSPLPDKSR